MRNLEFGEKNSFLDRGLKFGDVKGIRRRRSVSIELKEKFEDSVIEKDSFFFDEELKFGDC